MSTGAPSIPPGYRPQVNPNANSQYNFLSSRAAAGSAAGLPPGYGQTQQGRGGPSPAIGQSPGGGQQQFALGVGRGQQGYPYGHSNVVGLGQQVSNHAPSLDLSDSSFPALGSAPSTTAGNSAAPSSNATVTAANSYATQAGSAASNTNGPSYALANGAQARTTAELSQEDFPAFGAGGQGQGEQVNGTGVYRPGTAQGQQGQGGQAGLSQEQLQQQQLHRQSLLGAMKGLGGGVGAYGGDADKRNYGFKLNSTTLTPGSAPSAQGPIQSTWSQYGTGGGGGGTGANHLFPQAQQQSLANPNSTTNPAQLPSPMRSPIDLQSHSLIGAGVGGVGGFGGLSLQPGQGLRAPIAPTGPPGAGLASTIPAGATASTPAQQVLTSPADRFGLLGLLQIIKSPNPSLGLVALGNDLASLGLDLNAPDLASTFQTPFTDRHRSGAEPSQPDFQLPACYQTVQAPSLPSEERLKGFSEELLFFIFYSQPRDQMQEFAAQQLYKKNWRYHKELALWLTKPAGSEAVQKAPTYERGTYIFFDPSSWEKVPKEFLLVYEALETRPQTTGSVLPQPPPGQPQGQAQGQGQGQPQAPGQPIGQGKLGAATVGGPQAAY